MPSSSNTWYVILALFTTGLHAQTPELIQMPLAELQAKADAGNAEALLQLGMRYNLGTGVPQSKARTKAYMEKAAAAGSSTAQGICARNGFGMKADPQMAFSLFEKAAAKGDLTALRNLGYCYEKGIGCTKDGAKAFELYQKTAASQDPMALYYLGNAYSNGVGTEKDPAKAVEFWEQAATTSSAPLIDLVECYEKGIGCLKDQAHAIELLTQGVEAQYSVAVRELGARYWLGSGVEKDLNKAHELYQKAGELGDGKALVWFGGDYFQGVGVEKSFAKGETLWLKAGELDFPEAWSYLADKYKDGQGVERNYTRANELYQKAGDNGYARAYANLGLSYESGNGVDKNLKKANELYLKAGELGEGIGYNYLGANYQNGNGMTKDVAKANELYRKASELGEVLGYVNLGVNYENGNGLPKDVKKANELYLKAGEMGSGAGYANLGANYQIGNGVIKDVAKANEYYLKAVGLGNLYAMNNLGTNLRDGYGIAKDLPKAVELLQKAAEGGNEWGMWNLGKCYSGGRGVKKEMAKAVELFTQASEKNHAAATYDLGSCYENGLGVKKDKTKARALYEKAAGMGNTDAQARLKDIGPSEPPAAQKASASSGTRSAAPMAAVTRLLADARRELDMEQFSICIEHCGTAISQLDAEKAGDWLPWTLAHATMAAAYHGMGADRKLNDASVEQRHHTKALAIVSQGLLAGSHEAELKKQQPDRVARLLEIRGSVRASLAVVEGVTADEAQSLWQQAVNDWNEALQTAKGRLFQASVHRAAARGYLREGGRGNQPELIAKGRAHAEQAIQLSAEDPAGSLLHARSQILLAGAFTMPLALQGITEVDHPDMVQAEKLIQQAAVVFQETVPGTQDDKDARQYLADFRRSHDIKAWNGFARIMNGLSPSSQSDAESERQRVLRGMADENYRARQEGRQEPNPGVR